MHILHGTWLIEDQQFIFWGEDTRRELHYRKGRRGKTAPHPLALSIDSLLRYIDRFTTESEPSGRPITIWLPGLKKQVQPSPQAEAAGVPPLTQNLELLAWELEVITLNPAEYLDLILQLPTEPRGFQLGHDLFFWQQVGLLIMNGLVEGRYMPTLLQQGTQWLAAWTAQPDTTIFEQLVANMPLLCRAVVDDIDLVPSPAHLLQNCLDNVTDAFVREAAQSEYAKSMYPWLQGLTSSNRVVLDTPAKNRKLWQSWENWQVIESGATGTYRVCFRLEEPPEEGADWYLSYLLQALDDPSLLVTAEQIWASKSGLLEYLEHRFINPQEKLLAALGLASRVFPSIEDSLRTAYPVGMSLSSTQAYQFLTEAAVMLEANGFSVLVPNWWSKRTQLKARAKVKAQDPNTATGILSRDALLDYTWEVSVGEDALSEDEFEQLVELKQPLVRYRGEWIALDPTQVDGIRDFFATSPGGEIGVLDTLKMMADGSQHAPTGVELTQVDIEDTLAQIFKHIQQPETTEALPIPQQLKATLRPYQERGLGWLAQMYQMGLGACLADDMGLGKTLQTIAFWLYVWEKWDIQQPALLVCPTSVVGNWSHEIGRFAPKLSHIKHQGANRLREEAFVKAAQKTQVVLTSYALMQRDADFLKKIEWSSVVLDEAQNIKNPSTKQSQATRALSADFRIALTGTPVENRLSELWSIMQFLNRDYLGSLKAFRANFALPIERYGDENAAATLRKLTQPFILRRVKTDPAVIQDLPDKFENKVYCTLSGEQATLYEATVREEMDSVDSADNAMARRGTVLRMLTHLKQICNHPAHFLKEGTHAGLDDRSGKLTRLVEMLEEIREVNENTLIFTQYAEMGTLLQNYLRDYFVDEVLFLHGGTPATKREEMVRLFQSRNGPPIFLLSLKAGGTGLNLTRANHVFHFDRWYNPAVENQATDRAFRIGQTKDVQVHKFICLGTLEERIDELIDHKKNLADQIVGSGESWISELNSRELRELVSLRHEAMEV